MNAGMNEAKRAKAAMALAKKLDAACEAMRQFVHACVACGEAYPYADDQRLTMQATMREYANWLETAHRQ